jgi:predicted nucleic acid-binding protein
VVADTSPLIFLAKIHRLDLLWTLFEAEILVPSVVRDELMAPPATPAEELDLRAFLGRAKVVTVRRPRHFAAALSDADSAALSLAIRKRADILLADDRLLRQLARLEAVRPVGTLGVLLRSLSKGHVTPDEARRMVTELVQEHRLRISIEVFEAVLREIDAHR